MVPFGSPRGLPRRCRWRILPFVLRRGVLLALVALLLLPAGASAGRDQTLTATNASANLTFSPPASMSLVEQVTNGITALSSSASSNLQPRTTRSRPSIAGPAAGSVTSTFSAAALRGQHGVTVLLVTDPSFVSKAATFLDHLAALGVNSVSAV